MSRNHDTLMDLEPSRNMSAAVSFIVNGAQKRRVLATKRALVLQQNMGLLPRLSLVEPEPQREQEGG